MLLAVSDAVAGGTTTSLDHDAEEEQNRTEQNSADEADS